MYCNLISVFVYICVISKKISSYTKVNFMVILIKERYGEQLFGQVTALFYAKRVFKRCFESPIPGLSMFKF